MNKYAIQHIPDSEYAYPLDGNTLRLVLKAAKGEKFKEVSVLWNNKYDFAKLRKFTRMRKLCSDAEYDYYIADLKSGDVRYAYIFLLTTPEDEEYYYSEEGVTREYDFKHGYYTFFQFPYINAADIAQRVKWAEEAAVYQIFIDRFNRGDERKDGTYITQEWGAVPKAKDFAGGDLKGITEKLDTIKEMGFNTLYLTPVFCSPSNHKYNITDYTKVDPMFGKNEDLYALLAAAHGRGMHVILDTVFNHCDEGHPYFADVKEKGRESGFYDWFIVHGDFPEKYSARHPERSEFRPLAGTPAPARHPERSEAQSKDLALAHELCNYEIFADCTYMPKWNTSEPKVREYLTNIALTYLGWGIDGLRLDVADEVSHTFWRELRGAVKARYPEALLIGEVWHESGMYVREDGLDGVMNYKLQKVYADYFAGGKLTAEEAAGKINRAVMRHRRQTNGMMLNFLDDHDTPRFLRLAGEAEEKLRRGLIALYFTAGMPCVLYGTELPLTGDSDPDCRRTYDWTREPRHGRFIAGLAKMRRALPAGEFYAETEGGVLVLVRENGTECAKAYFGKAEPEGEAIYEYKEVKIVREKKWTVQDC